MRKKCAKARWGKPRPVTSSNPCARSGWHSYFHRHTAKISAALEWQAGPDGL